MSDPENVTTPSGAEVPPDEPQDPATLQSAESLDEDELGVDPVAQDVDMPEHWSPATARRPTPREQREGESLDEHLAEEEPDLEPVEKRPLAETRMHELDETTDERAAEQVADEEAPGYEP